MLICQIAAGSTRKYFSIRPQPFVTGRNSGCVTGREAGSFSCRGPQPRPPITGRHFPRRFQRTMLVMPSVRGLLRLFVPPSLIIAGITRSLEFFARDTHFLFKFRAKLCCGSPIDVRAHTRRHGAHTRPETLHMVPGMFVNSIRKL